MVDTLRAIDALLTLMPIESAGVSAQDIRDMLVSLDDTGWAAYTDTQHTSGSPQSVSANTDTILTINEGTKIETYLPRDLTSMFAGNKVKGKTGDCYTITTDFIAVPQDGSATYLEQWFDIGGAVGELYRRPVTFPKGAGVERTVVFSTMVYTLDTWEANGATIYVRGNGGFEIYNKRIIVARHHRGSR